MNRLYKFIQIKIMNKKRKLIFIDFLNYYGYNILKKKVIIYLIILLYIFFCYIKQKCIFFCDL